MLDELQNGPWPSFISGSKKLRDDHPEKRIICDTSRDNEAFRQNI